MAVEPAVPSPLFMWAGGKTRLLKFYRDNWPNSDGYGQYVDPFLGAGAVFSWVVSQDVDLARWQAITIGDCNVELMGVFAAVRNDPDAFIDDVGRLARAYLRRNHSERRDWYYQMRQRYWDRPGAPLLYMLMRTGFNGIWQTCKASHGLYGTPAGLLNHQRLDQIISPALIYQWSAMLKRATLHTGDFAAIPVRKEHPALIYLDPPYRDSFTTYGTGFDDVQQGRVCDWIRLQHAHGHRVLLANRCVEGDDFFEERLGDICNFHYCEVTYTAGRRKRTQDGFAAKPAREFLAVTR